MELPDDWGCGEYHTDVRKRIAELEAERDTAIEEIKRLASFKHPDVNRYIESNREWATAYVRERTRAENAEAEVERLRQQLLELRGDQ